MGPSDEHRCHLMLQWGLGLSTEEGAEWGDRYKDRPPASMGPRSFNRGRVPSASSMLIPLLSLQWGLGLSTEEGFQGIGVIEPEAEGLQWGLGLSTEEGLNGT